MDDSLALWAWVNHAGYQALESYYYDVKTAKNHPLPYGTSPRPGVLASALGARGAFFRIEDPVLPRAMGPCMQLLADQLSRELAADPTCLSPSATRYALTAFSAFWPGPWHPVLEQLEPAALALVPSLPPRQLHGLCRSMVVVRAGAGKGGCGVCRLTHVCMQRWCFQGRAVCCGVIGGSVVLM